MSDEVAHILAAADADNEIAMLGLRIGTDCLRIVLDSLGGCEIYLPRFDNFIESLIRAERDTEICCRYQGANTKQLAIEYNLTPRRIQQIVAKQKISIELNDG